MELDDFQRQPQRGKVNNRYLNSVDKEQNTGAEKDNIRETIERLKKVSITHQNAVEAYNLVKNKNEMIETSIANLSNRIETLREELKIDLGDRRTNEIITNDHIIPEYIFQKYVEMFEAMGEMFTFKVLQNELLKILCLKIHNALQAVKALDIEREVTAGMRETNKEWSDLTKNLVNEKFKMIDNKIEISRDISKREMEAFQQQVLVASTKNYEKLQSAFIIAIKAITSEANKQLIEMSTKTGIAPKLVQTQEKHATELIDIEDELAKIRDEATDNAQEFQSEREGQLGVDMDERVKLGGKQPQPMKQPIQLVKQPQRAQPKTFSKPKQSIDEDEEEGQYDEHMGEDNSDELEALDEKSYPCDKCPRVFNAKSALDLHKQMVH